MTEKRIGQPVNPRRPRLVTGLAAVVLFALLAGIAGAQSSGSYDLSWYSLDSGSGVLSGTEYRMVGTLGESLAGRATGDRYALVGGYDSGVPERAHYQFYLPIVLRNNP
jgi:hypothetical protein